MMKFSMKKVTTAAMATVAMLAMSAGSALAAPTFTIDPSVIPGDTVAINPFNATFISGNSSELLHQTATGNTGTGWVQFTSFANNGSAVLPFVSGLQNEYGLYLKFTITTTYTGGGTGNGSIGSNYIVTQLDFTVFADPGSPVTGPPNNTYTNADASVGFGTEATVGGTAGDIVLAIGSLVSGVAGINDLGGAFINTIQNFAVCSGAGTALLGATTIAAPSCGSNIGTAYFTAPVPFYNIAFDAFNNTTQGITRGFDASGNPTIGIANAIGGVDFNNGVPEPGSMVLLGIALAGLGISSRRNKNKAAKAA